MFLSRGLNIPGFNLLNLISSCCFEDKGSCGFSLSPYSFSAGINLKKDIALGVPKLL